MPINRKLIQVGVIALILGGLVAWFLWPTPVSLPTANTETEIQKVLELVEDLNQEIKEIKNATKQKVVIIHEQVKKDVEALTPDGVAVDLNNELALWRSRDVDPKGVASP